METVPQAVIIRHTFIHKKPRYQKLHAAIGGGRPIRLPWIRHWMDHTSLCVTALQWVPDGRRRRGIPRKTWRRTVEKERSTLGRRSLRQARIVVQDVDIASRHYVPTVTEKKGIC